MKNIWKIFQNDVVGLVKNPFALVIAIGLCVIPSLYAWFNIYSNWDPYANTANIHIAVATEDAGYTLNDGTTVNMGDEVLESLKENDKIGWVFLDSADEAVDGVYSGKYYAAVIISENFTYSMYNVFREDFAGPTILYYENEKKNAVATKITDTAVSTLKQSINKSFIEVVVSNIFSRTNTLSEELEEGDSFDRFIGRLRDLNDNLISYSDMISSFVAGNAALADAVAEVNESIPSLSSDVAEGSEGFNDAGRSLGNTRTTLDSFGANVTGTLDGIKGSIDRISADLLQTNLAASAQQTADNLNQTMADTQALLDQLKVLQEELLKRPVLREDTGSTESIEIEEEIKKLEQAIGEIQNGATDIRTWILNLNGGSGSETIVADTVTASLGNLSQLLNNCSASVDNMKNVYVNSIVPQMNGLLDSMEQMTENVTKLLDNINDTLGDMSSVFSGIESTMTGANASLEEVQGVLDEVSEKLTELLERLDGAGEDEKVQAFFDFLEGDPEVYGEFFAEPVQVTTEAVYEIPNYGSAMTPFYSVLALWVGGTVLVALIKVKAEPKGLSDVKSWQLYFGRYLLFFVLGQIQAAIIAAGDIYLLHTHILYPGLFFAAASLTSFTFTLLIYTLALSFGDIGKAAAVVIMVIQIAGSGGTFPIELLPEIYRNIYIFFPFPYAINAMRETMGGMYGSDYMKFLAELLIFAAAALFIGLVIRLPFVKINHFMEERMEDTGLM